jgi:CheY-like chemotaxis protein
VVLSRILETHDLDVDTAESAEAALEYLNDYRPDVIFMDHMMPGMDGFQAVEAIKKDPRTATIPIMMYTSQKGEVYVGQARALGAIGVLPKEVEPVAVSKVLESLHIIGEPAKQDDFSEVFEAAETEAQHPSLENMDSEMRFMLEDLFDQQRAILKQDMRKSSEAIAAKVADQIKATDEEVVEPRGDGLSEISIPPSSIAILVLSIICATLILLYLQQASRLKQTITENRSLGDTIGQLRSSATNNEVSMRQQIVEGRSTKESISASAFAAIEWGFNRSGQYPWGQEPLGDMRLADFEALSQHLEDADFVGQVFIDTHVGEHCLVLESGSYNLAPPDLIAANCDIRRLNYEEGLEMSRRISVAMSAFLRATEERTAGRIRFVIQPFGATNPLRNYPLTAEDVTAGDWNRIADSNSRIQISLLPDPG